MHGTTILGWLLVAGGAACGIGAAAVHGGLLEALTAASGACTSYAAMWGYLNKPPAYGLSGTGGVTTVTVPAPTVGS